MFSKAGRKLRDKYPNRGYAVLHEGTLKAVHDDDIEALFSSLGILQQFKDGACNCLFCDEVVNLSNFAAIVPCSGEIRLCCNKPACIAQALKG